MSAKFEDFEVTIEVFTKFGGGLYGVATLTVEDCTTLLYVSRPSYKL